VIAAAFARARLGPMSNRRTLVLCLPDGLPVAAGACGYAFYFWANTTGRVRH
jgi:hypothetical protein